MSPVWAEQWLHGRVAADGQLTIPIHPTQLYEALGALVLLVGLLFARRFQSRHGDLLVAAGIGYGVLRLLCEALRGDPDRGVLRMLNVNAWCALVSMALLGVIWRRARSSRPS
jgi:phosphatidylglycerol:prolipoprotein diacylglycerol transferase